MDNLESLFNREKVPVHNKVTEKPELGSHLVSFKPKLLYKYYKCDFCGKEIKILEKKSEMEGGLIYLSSIFTQRGELRMALHNSCLRPFQNYYKEYVERGKKNGI